MNNSCNNKEKVSKDKVGKDKVIKEKEGKDKGKYKDTGFPQLNNEARELVYKKYEKDFHLFNYK